jgi:hypothetical protein
MCKGSATTGLTTSRTTGHIASKNAHESVDGSSKRLGFSETCGASHARTAVASSRPTSWTSTTERRALGRSGFSNGRARSHASGCWQNWKSAMSCVRTATAAGRTHGLSRADGAGLRTDIRRGGRADADETRPSSYSVCGTQCRVRTATDDSPSMRWTSITAILAPRLSKFRGCSVASARRGCWKRSVSAISFVRTAIVRERTKRASTRE